MIKTLDLEISQFLEISHITLEWFLTKCIDEDKCSPTQLECYLTRINRCKSIDEQKVFLLNNFSLYARTIFKIYNEVKNFSVGLAAIKDHETGKWGYIDTHFKLVIPAIYEEANNFNPFGYALVKQNGCWTMINKNNDSLN
jgi:hypothetical protein